jgi:hypothetical protein
MKVSLHSLIAFVAIPIAVAAVVGGYVWSLQAAERSKLLDQFSPVVAPQNDTIMKDDELLKKYIATYGPAPTMKVLIAASGRAGIDCHNRAHEFGRMSYEHFSDEVLKLNLPECHSGFYHGAIEAYFKKNGTDGLREKLSTICPSTLNIFFMHQCRHGLGHGLMAWSSYELPETLEYCNLIDDPGGKASCRTGAYMENIVGSIVDPTLGARSTGHFTKYLSDDPQFPCNSVKEEYKADCYFLQTDRMLFLANHNPQGIADGCAAAPVQYQFSCFSSMGRTVGGMTRGRPEEALRICRLVPDHENRVRCIGYVARDLLWDPSGQEAGFTFCGVVPPEDGKKECYQGLIENAVSILSREQYTAFCSRLPQDMYTECTAVSPS